MGFIKLDRINYLRDDKIILNNISFILPRRHSLAIVGSSGSGKTMLARLLCGQIKATSGEIYTEDAGLCLMVDQQENFLAASHMHSGYYGQRYENLAMEDVPTVEAYLQNLAVPNGNPVSREIIVQSLRMLESEGLIGKKLMMLSNGERKRLQIAIALIRRPEVLILDQPFVGLDRIAREKLGELVLQLHNSEKTIIIICDSAHIPEEIDFVLELKNGEVSGFCQAKDFLPATTKERDIEIGNQFEDELKSIREETFQFAVRMNKVKVSFGENVILKDIDWEVKKGERWALMGPNGAGKTTLLSLITADNPQGYANDLILFDRKRGSGESIWDIKKRIGVVSPELHLYFLRGKGIFNSIPDLQNAADFIGTSILCPDVISSGFHDLVGFSDKTSGYNRKIVKKWLRILELEHLEESWFNQASLSEQRLLLLARALVKFPSLLILDEPCQGLDLWQSKLFTRILDKICLQLGTTLVYVTHYPDEIPESVQYLLQLESGTVKSRGEFDRKAS